MSKDYYEILGLRRDSTEEEVAQNYKKKVLRWHPKFAKEDQTTAHYHFSEISEAFEVLSDPIKRAFYDKYGW
jgi:curved DNA-binding protein CbpA